MKKLFLSIVSLLGLLALGMEVPYGPKVSFFLDVSAPLAYESKKYEYVAYDNDNEFEVHDGKLYLLMEVSQRMLLMQTAGSVDWGHERLESLRKKNPQLEKYWPDPAAKNLGVAWAKQVESEIQ